MKRMSKKAFKQCVPPCPRFITDGDSHEFCVKCLGMEHAKAALEGAACEHCLWLPQRSLLSRLALFDESGSIRKPHGSGPASAEAVRGLQSWGSQMDLLGGETASVLSHPSNPIASGKGLGARMAASPAPSGSSMHCSSSEELESVSVQAVETEDHETPLSQGYEELLEVVTRAVAKLSVDWPQDQQQVTPISKLDERYLKKRVQPQRRGLPFFPDLHTEVSKSWKKPFSSRISTTASSFSSVIGAREKGYGMMPKVEESLATYLSPEAASSLKPPTLPTKPCRITSNLVGKAYMAAGRAGSCLHTMGLLQAYQADLLGDIKEGEVIDIDLLNELKAAADLTLRATKETAQAVGRSMGALVATERHLWLNLSGIKEKDKSVLLDAPLSDQGLFGNAVDTVVDRFQEAKRQAAAFQNFLPRRSYPQGPAAQRQPQPSTTSALHRQQQKQSVATRTPPQRAWGSRQQSQKSSRQVKPDLRTVVFSNRKAAAKRS